MAKQKSIGVHMRLPADVVAKLDSLATSTHGSRADVVKLLVRQAEVDYRLERVWTVKLVGESERVRDPEKDVTSGG